MEAAKKSGEQLREEQFHLRHPLWIVRVARPDRCLR
jgi:hypothetical protein